MISNQVNLLACIIHIRRYCIPIDIIKQVYAIIEPMRCVCVIKHCGSLLLKTNRSSSFGQDQSNRFFARHCGHFPVYLLVQVSEGDDDDYNLLLIETHVHDQESVYKQIIHHCNVGNKGLQLNIYPVANMSRKKCC